MSRVREKGKRVKEFQSSCENQQTLSPPLSFSLSNRQHVELRISRQLLTSSAWPPTNWNTITVKSHTHRNRYAGTHSDVSACCIHGMTNTSAMAVMKQTRTHRHMDVCVCTYTLLHALTERERAHHFPFSPSLLVSTVMLQSSLTVIHSLSLILCF